MFNWKNNRLNALDLESKYSSMTSWFVEPAAAPLDGTSHSCNRRTAEAEDINKCSSFEDKMLVRNKQQRSGSLDRLLSPMSAPSAVSVVGPFRKETGDSCEGMECDASQSYALVENPESATRWYFKYFLGRVHYNFMCYDSQKNPFFLSIVWGDAVLRCILWKKTGNKRLCIPLSGKTPPPKAILEKFGIKKYDKTIKDISNATIQKDFLTLEEQEGAVNFKFGVIYATAGQATDNEMLSNKVGSSSFHQFLSLLGETVDLLGWSHFKGGLDNKNDSTGTQSVYTVFSGHEIMFHVSTMLPYSNDDSQQLERKRHIGNDIVVIIFVDGDEAESYQSCLDFRPSSIISHFNHIFALVCLNKTQNSYRLVLYSPESVPIFGPPLPFNGEFTDHLAFRDFLLAKLINSEKAAYCTPTFADKRERTLSLLMKDMERRYTTELRKSFTQLNGTSPSTSRKYQELEQSFTEVGQKLKIEKIMSGHHPTSQITTALKREPWEVSLMLGCFPHKIVCGDVCDDTLIVATASDGAHLIFKNGSFVQIIDKAIPIVQMSIAHRHQLLLFRTGYAKDSNYFYAVPLNQFFTETVKLYTKASLHPYKVPYTKGCHLFCTTSLDDQFLRVMIAVKCKVFMLLWKYPATLLGGSTTPNLEMQNFLDGFVKHRELTLNDVPIMMTYLDDTPSGKLCVMYQKQSNIEAIDEHTTESQKLYNFDSSKIKITELKAVQTSTKNELLLGCNMTCNLLTLHQGMVFNSPEIVWNAEPKHIAYYPPYIVSFTIDTIEIRTCTNGCLIHTIDVPDLKLITQKDDIIFTSRHLLNQSLTRMESLTRLEGKAAKVCGKTNQSEYIHIYKLTLDIGGGGRRTSLTPLLRGNSELDEVTSTDSISDETTSSGNGDILESSLPKELIRPRSPRRQMLVLPQGPSANGHVVHLDSLMEDYTGILCTSPESDAIDDSPPITMRPIGKITSIRSINDSSNSVVVFTSDDC